jgi:hypothetical protein
MTPRIAYNQHRPAPALSARAKRDPEGFAEETRQARNAAKEQRRARRAAPPKASTPRAPRLRRLIRDNLAAQRRARARDDFKTLERLSKEYGTLLARRVLL